MSTEIPRSVEQWRDDQMRSTVFDGRERCCDATEGKRGGEHLAGCSG